MVSPQICDYIDNEVIKLAKCLLKKHVFIGTFIENRFVQQLNIYRQIITVKDTETDFLDNLKVVKRRLEDAISRKVWIGITLPDTLGTPNGYNLWVQLNEQVFGRYIFKVRTIKFLPNEIRLSVDILKPYQLESTPTNDNNVPEQVDDLTEICANVLDKFKDLFDNIKTVTTWENFFNTIRFLFVLFCTICTAGFKGSHYLLEYFLRFLNVLAKVGHAFYPYFNLVVTFLAFIVMNIFNFLHSMFNNRRQPAYNNNRQMYLTNYDARALPAPRSPRDFMNFNARALPAPSWSMDSSNFNPRPSSFQRRSMDSTNFNARSPPFPRRYQPSLSIHEIN